MSFYTNYKNQNALQKVLYICVCCKEIRCTDICQGPLDGGQKHPSIEAIC